ncbi:hypothetical protein RIF29_29704 [Crotalaria pallida]|uniref:At1g61320/AtMIF1 LRR domain-containing protein n=1 Tax=Crotalaria pallida TaxID=3830 RepID=A0AAN9ELU1_CROPI
MFGRKVEMKRTEKDLIDLERTEFVQRVNQFFQKFNTTKIDSLRVAYHLTSGQRSSIDRWISFGLTRGVERIHLNFTSYDYVYTSKLERYVFPLLTLSKSGVSTLKHIHLQSCILPNPPANFSAVPFRNLRSLVLYHVHVGQDLITSLLSECVLLEELSLIGCEFALLKLKIVSSSLLHLHFSQSFENWITFECHKLSYLEFYGDIPPCYRDILWCCATKAPLLKRVLFNIYPTSTMPDILASLANLLQLEILSLDVFQTTNISLVENSLRTIPPFKNLKELNLFIAGELMDEELKYEFDNLWIFTILRACPLLQKLSIMFICPKLLANQKENKDLGMFSHNELKVIELGGCIGNWYEIEFAMNVLKYVHTLERIIMSPFWKDPGYFGSSLYSDEEWFQNGREIVREKLHCCEKAGQAQLILI